MTQLQIFSYWPATLQQRLRRWWNGRIEKHCLMCAAVEQQRADEHLANVAFYQKRAAFARSSAR